MKDVYAPYNVQIVTTDPSPMPHHEAIVAGTVVDGEVMRHGGETIYWLFDVLEFAGEDVSAEPYVKRFERLTDEIHRSDTNKFHMGMKKQSSNQLSAAIPTATDHCRFHALGHARQFNRNTRLPSRPTS